MELVTLDNLKAVLEEYGQAVRNLYQDNLILHDRIASGDLLNSVEFRVVEGDHTYEVQLTLAEYWKFVEYDTKPHWPPVAAILEWIRVKPVLPRPDDKGRIPTPQQLAFLIGRKIAREGTKGSHDLATSIEAINAQFKDKIIYALSADTTQIMKILIGEIRGALQ